MSDQSVISVEWILKNASHADQRTGQWLFNILPEEVANKVRGTLFDPFYKNLNETELVEWFDNHLIFFGDEIVGLFDGNTILWEKS